MAVRTIALDVLAAAVVLALLGIVLLGVLTAAVSALTLAGRRRRAAAGLAGSLGALSRGCAVGELAKIDEELQRIAEAEHAGAGWYGAR
jgi:hypothetical protein